MSNSEAAIKTAAIRTSHWGFAWPSIIGHARACPVQTRLLLLLLAITLAVFAGVCGHEFVHFDDNLNIYGNPHIQGLSWEHLQWMFTDTAHVRRYMPLGWLSYALDYQLFGLNPQAFHVGNLLLHLTNAVLLYFLLKHVLLLASKPAHPEQVSAAPVWCAAVGALFWAVNPLRVEVVAWASARIYALACSFAMFSVLAWMWAQNPATPSPRRRTCYWLAVAAYGASLLTYPVALFIPVALLVLEVVPLRRVGVHASGWWQRQALPIWRDKLPFLALTALGLRIAFRARVAPDSDYRAPTLEQFGLLPRLMQAFYVWCYYAWKPWAPYDLSAVYPTLCWFNPLGAGFLASAAVVIAISLALLARRRRWPGVFGLWLCHLAILIPVLGLTEGLHSAYDRYGYLHGVVCSAALALLLQQLWSRGKQAYLAAIVVTGATLLFALSSWQQVTVWSGTISLHQNIIARLGDNPRRARFDEVLGAHYLSVGLTNEAVASFQNALHYAAPGGPRYSYQPRLLSRTHVHLGDVWADQGRYGEALAEYQAALHLEPGSVDALVNLGGILGVVNRDGEAIECLEQALRLEPDSAAVHHQLALVLRKTGREQQALEHLQQEHRLLAGRLDTTGSNR